MFLMKYFSFLATNAIMIQNAAFSWFHDNHC